ncbi:hypothetical protein KC19_VG200400 [Ceratodon purpureus]|uniref:Uncharacterized protein n=1 Tax=Ceratodon purpureus TaxID=3225 RepID=A0A8T0HRY0_CERPU|nr:hypothetical protein KC19_VG200400 [Ceratodon purpureus]
MSGRIPGWGRRHNRWRFLWCGVNLLRPLWNLNRHLGCFLNWLLLSRNLRHTESRCGASAGVSTLAFACLAGDKRAGVNRRIPHGRSLGTLMPGTIFSLPLIAIPWSISGATSRRRL